MERATLFKSDSRTVTVKGFVEKEVKADQAIWVLRFTTASEEIRDAHARISSDREATVAFLKKQGFKDEDIGQQPTRTVDKLIREHGRGKRTCGSLDCQQFFACDHHKYRFR